jgi:hypothetical protein
MQSQGSRAPRNGPREPQLANCKTCGDPEVSTALIRGECPECSGQLTLPLRGEGGRFLGNLGPRHRAGGGRS